MEFIAGSVFGGIITLLLVKTYCEGYISAKNRDIADLKSIIRSYHKLCGGIVAGRPECIDEYYAICEEDFDVLRCDKTR